MIGLYVSPGTSIELGSAMPTIHSHLFYLDLYISLSYLHVTPGRKDKKSD